jgi:hypothetical protein
MQRTPSPKKQLFARSSAEQKLNRAKTSSGHRLKNKAAPTFLKDMDTFAVVPHSLARSVDDTGNPMFT